MISVGYSSIIISVWTEFWEFTIFISLTYSFFSYSSYSDEVKLELLELISLSSIPCPFLPLNGLTFYYSIKSTILEFRRCICGNSAFPLFLSLSQVLLRLTNCSSSVFISWFLSLFGGFGTDFYFSNLRLGLALDCWLVTAWGIGWTKRSQNTGPITDWLLLWPPLNGGIWNDLTSFKMLPLFFLIFKQVSIGSSPTDPEALGDNVLLKAGDLSVSGRVACLGEHTGTN